MRSVIYPRYLRGQSHKAFKTSRNDVMSTLVRALGIQVEMRLGDVWQDIETVVRCHELLKSDMSNRSITRSIMALAIAVQSFRSEESNEGSKLFDKVIKCPREANVRIPNDHGVSICSPCFL